jgi:Outer membrane lipoprotein-sorting protein
MHTVEKTRKKGTLALVTLLITAFFLHADESAGEIIRKVDGNLSAATETAVLRMTVIDDISDPGSSRSFEADSIARGADDSVLVFREPRRMAGLSILSREDGQWVYFPSTGRVRKLSGAARKESVSGVGGDFSYEDLGGGNWGDTYSFRLLGGTEECWTLEGVPTDREISYRRIEMEVGKADFLVRRIRFFTEGTEPEKILTVEEVRDFEGRRRPAVMTMENAAKKSRTRIEFLEMSFDHPLTDERFHPRLFFR